MKRNRLVLISELVLSVKIAPADNKLTRVCDKSFVDDLVASGYCKYESNLVLRSTEVFAVFLRFVLPCSVKFSARCLWLGVYV